MASTSRIRSLLEFRPSRQLAAIATALLVLSVQLSVRGHEERQASGSTGLHGPASLRQRMWDSIQVIDPEHVADCLVEAVVQVESGGSTRKVGSAGERGLMQIKRDTWAQVTRGMFGRAVDFNRAFEPETNRRVGRAYLAEIQGFLHRYRGAWRSDERSLLLACYNAGPARVRQVGFDVRRLSACTRSYVERATNLHEHYLAAKAPAIRRLLVVQNRLVGRSLDS